MNGQSGGINSLGLGTAKAVTNLKERTEAGLPPPALYSFGIGVAGHIYWGYPRLTKAGIPLPSWKVGSGPSIFEGFCQFFFNIVL